MVIHDWAAPPWSNETPEAKHPPQGLNACILPDARRALTSTRRRRTGHGTRSGLNAGPVNTLCKTIAKVCGMRFVGHTWRKPKQRAEPPRHRAHHAEEWLRREGLRRGSPKRQLPTLMLALAMLRERNAHDKRPIRTRSYPKTLHCSLPLAQGVGRTRMTFHLPRSAGFRRTLIWRRVKSSR